MRIGVAMWPIQSWRESRELWERAEQLGFAHGWVYDHTAWRGHTPWYDAYSTLAAVAATTSRMELGTLVTSPNFRHPVPVAHAVNTIDDIAAGRLRVGIGAGGQNIGSDGGRLGGPQWTPAERADRLEEWVTLLDRLLTGPETTRDGRYYSAREFRIEPAGRRPPFAIAGNGPRGMRLAARYADTWISTGEADADDPVRALGARLARLDDLAEGGVPNRLLLTGFTGEPWLESQESFRDLAGRYGELGITDIVVHWPRPGSPWDADMKTFERVVSGA